MLSKYRRLVHIPKLCRTIATVPDEPSARTLTPIPNEAAIVIVGGGAVGTSIAYHLAKAGQKDIVLLEKAQLTHGCTWHAAGLLGQLRGTKNLTRMLQYSTECYTQLTEDTGVDPSWKPTGSLRLASSSDRWTELKRLASQGTSFGFDIQLLSAEEAVQKCPILNPEGLKGAAWVPSDGSVEPTLLTNAFAKGARQRGVKIIQGVQVVGLNISKRNITELRVVRRNEKDVHTIKVGKVVNAAGLWARDFGLMMNCNVPTVNVEHQYLVTERIPGLPEDLPSFRDPDLLLYYKPETGGLVIGGWEDNTVPSRVPLNFEAELYPPNWERFQQHLDSAFHRTPVVQTVGARSLINGPIPVSADGEPIMGRQPELDNVFVAAGFTAGIGQSGGAGKYMAEWIINGQPSVDLWPLDIRRFGSYANNRNYLEAKGVESYGSYYKLHPPFKESKNPFPRKSPLYHATTKLGAVMGSKFGWVRPNWFALDKDGSPVLGVKEQPSYHRPMWFEYVKAEHKAARETVAILDQSSFAKMELFGPRAFECIQRLVVNDMSGPPGTVVYTQMCNERGGIEADITIAKLAQDKYYIITGSGFAIRDFGWIKDNLPRDPITGEFDGVQVRELTNSLSCINVVGPNSRKLLESVGVEIDDISNEAFPFMTCKHLRLGMCDQVLALRVTFVGELGYELHVNVEQAESLYSLLWEKGQSLGVRNAGYRSLESLRLEKGYRVWGSDMDCNTNPYEVGLGFCVKLNKPGGFIGVDALRDIQKQGPTRKLACFVVDEKYIMPQSLGLSGDQPLLLWGNEAIFHQGKLVGSTTSCGYGYSVEKHIIYGMIPSSLTKETQFTLHAYGTEIPMTRQPWNRSLYDSERKKILI